MAKKKDGTVTKAAAVREALAEGVDKPEEGIAYIKQKYGLEMTAQQYSTYKSIEKKRASVGAAGRSGATRAPRRKAAAAPVGNGSPVDLARQVKALVETYGAGPVKEMAEVFAG